MRRFNRTHGVGILMVVCMCTGAIDGATAPPPCWDANANSICDPMEDVDGNGRCDWMDCIERVVVRMVSSGTIPGTNALTSCWDANNDGVCTIGPLHSDDTNNDGICTWHDCIATEVQRMIRSGELCACDGTGGGIGGRNVPLIVEKADTPAASVPVTYFTHKCPRGWISYGPARGRFPMGLGATDVSWYSADAADTANDSPGTRSPCVSGVPVDIGRADGFVGTVCALPSMATDDEPTSADIGEFPTIGLYACVPTQT